jgi:phosphate transport system protein
MLMSGSLHDRAFGQQLHEVREKLLSMAAHVEAMIHSAVIALARGDVKLADETIALDRKVNQAELDTDELCLLILAERQPLASDLRFVAFSLKMVTDLERIGDLAVNISERVRDLAAEPVTPRPALDSSAGIEELGAMVQAMVKDAIDAFVRSDDKKAEAVIARDAGVDELYQRVFSALLTQMTHDASAVRRGVHLQSVAKWLERIGDHAANLAETAIFMMKGKDVRHTLHVSAPPPRDQE